MHIICVHISVTIQNVVKQNPRLIKKQNSTCSQSQRHVRTITQSALTGSTRQQLGECVHKTFECGTFLLALVCIESFAQKPLDCTVLRDLCCTTVYIRLMSKRKFLISSTEVLVHINSGWIRPTYIQTISRERHGL